MKPKTAKQINTEVGVGEGRVVLGEIVEKQLAKELYDKIAKGIFGEIEEISDIADWQSAEGKNPLAYREMLEEDYQALKEKYGGH